MGDDELSSYEKIRLENIERNQYFLTQIGLKSAIAEPSKFKKSAKRMRIEPQEFPTRRSVRVAELKTVDYTVWSFCQLITYNVR